MSGIASSVHDVWFSGVNDSDSFIIVIIVVV